MKKILLGIAFILYGLTMAALNGPGGGDAFLLVPGVLMPFVGIIIALVGAAEKDK